MTNRQPPSSLEVQHMICMLMIPMVPEGSEPVGSDTVILDRIDSLETMELILGLEDIFPSFDMDEIDLRHFGPTIQDAADAVSAAMSK